MISASVTLCFYITALHILISRLCDFKSLKKGRSKSDAANGSLRQKKIKTNGEIRLGDISSGSQSRSSEDPSNSEDDREEHAGFQVVFHN